jgi:hypothetical protein
LTHSEELNRASFAIWEAASVCVVWSRVVGAVGDMW